MTATFEMLMGSCSVAAQIEEGVVSSKLTAEEWHAECLGATVGVSGRTTRCSCECHPADLIPIDYRAVCARCGDDSDRPKEAVENRRVCVDLAQCEADREARAATDPRWRGIVEEEKRVVARQAAEHQTEAAKPAGTKRRGGWCEHCGQATAGGRFAPGHDAKLKSELTNAAIDADDPEAYAELLVRKWPVPTQTHDDIVDLATSIAQADDVDEWLTARNEARRG